MSEARPKGSGYFSLGVGIFFLFVLLASLDVDLRTVSTEWLLRFWLVFAATILVVWGVRRIATGRDDWTVGQSTLNFVVGVVGATVAIFAIVVQQPQAGAPASTATPAAQPASPVK